MGNAVLPRRTVPDEMSRSRRCDKLSSRNQNGVTERGGRLRAILASICTRSKARFTVWTKRSGRSAGSGTLRAKRDSAGVRKRAASRVVIEGGCQMAWGGSLLSRGNVLARDLLTRAPIGFSFGGVGRRTLRASGRRREGGCGSSRSSPVLQSPWRPLAVVATHVVIPVGFHSSAIIRRRDSRGLNSSSSSSSSSSGPSPAEPPAPRWPRWA